MFHVFIRIEKVIDELESIKETVNQKSPEAEGLLDTARDRPDSVTPLTQR